MAAQDARLRAVRILTAILLVAYVLGAGWRSR
jgi:hypothetical protein